MPFAIIVFLCSIFILGLCYQRADDSTRKYLQDVSLGASVVLVATSAICSLYWIVTRGILPAVQLVSI